MIKQRQIYQLHKQQSKMSNIIAIFDGALLFLFDRWTRETRTRRFFKMIKQNLYQIEIVCETKTTLSHSLILNINGVPDPPWPEN